MSQSESANECPVCLRHYNRQERVPRLLHCNHTFCTPCLERIALRNGTCGLCTVRCPLCRWTTCLHPIQGFGPKESLWVDSQLWDCIPSCDEEEEEEEIKPEDTAGMHTTTQQNKCSITTLTQSLVNLPTILSKLGFKQRPRILPTRPRQPPLIKPFWKHPCFGCTSKSTSRPETDFSVQMQ